MGTERKINRNKLKKAYENNKISKAWRTYQINKYGIQEWCKKYNDSQKVKNNANKATRGTAYII